MNSAHFALYCSDNLHQRVIFWKKIQIFWDYGSEKKQKDTTRFYQFNFILKEKGSSTAWSAFSNLILTRTIIEKNFYIYKFKVKPFSLVSPSLAKNTFKFKFSIVLKLDLTTCKPQNHWWNNTCFVGTCLTVTSYLLMTFKSTRGPQGTVGTWQKATSSGSIDISALNCMYPKSKGYPRIKEKQPFVNIIGMR